MRLAFVAPILLAGACGARTGDSSRPAASASSGPATVNPTNGKVTVSLEDPSFTTCHCHHGCGSGADGTFTLHVVNPTDAAAQVSIVDVVLTPTAAPAIGPLGYHTVRVDGMAAVEPIVVAAGSSTDLAVKAYLDGTSAEAGVFLLTIHLTIDGVPTQVGQEQLQVPFQTVEQCPGA